MAGTLDLPTLVQKVSLRADTSGAVRDAETGLDRIGAAATKAGKALTIGLTVPIVGLGIASVGAASDLNESISKVNVVFGESAGVIQEWAATAAESMGISTQAALEAAGTFGNLFRSLGIDVEGASAMSTSLVQLAADLASFNNANPEDVLLALRSGLLGEAEPLRQFGVSLSAARIEAEALASGLVAPVANAEDITRAQINLEKAVLAVAAANRDFGADSLQARDAAAKLTAAETALTEATAGSVPELTAAQKAQAAYAIILDDTALAQGDFSRTSDGLANQQRILSARFQDLKATIGQALLPFVLKLTGKASELLAKFLDLSPATQGLILKIAGIAAAAGPVLLIVGKLASSFSSIGTLLGSGSKLLSLGPLGLVLAAVAAAAFLVWKNWDKLAPVFERVKTFAVDAFRTISTGVDGFKAAFSGEGITSDGFVGVMERIGVAARVLVDFIATKVVPWVQENIPKAFAAVVDFLQTRVVPFIEDVLLPAFGEIGDFIRTKVLPALAAIGRFIQTKVLPNLKPIGIVVGLALGPLSALAAAAFLVIDNWEKIGPVFRSFVGFLKEDILPLVEIVGQTIVETIGSIVDFVRENWPQISEAIGHVMVVVKTIVTVVMAVVSQVIEKALRFIMFLWRTVGDDIFNVVKRVFEFILDTIANVMKVIQGIIEVVLAIINGDWGEAWNGIKDILAGIWDQIWNIVSTGVDLVKSALGAIASILLDLIHTPFEAAKKFVGDMIDDIVDFVKGLPDRIKEFVTKVAEAAADIGSAIWDGIVGAIGDLGEAGLELAQDAATFMVNAAKGILNGIIQAVNDLIPNQIPGVHQSLGPLGEITLFPDIDLPDNPIPSLARGGAFGAGPVLVGERGPELLFPKFPGLVASNSRMERLMGDLGASQGNLRSGDRYEVLVQTFDRPSGQKLGRDIAWGAASAKGNPFSIEPERSSSGR